MIRGSIAMIRVSGLPNTAERATKGLRKYVAHEHEHEWCQQVSAESAFYVDQQSCHSAHISCRFTEIQVKSADARLCFMQHYHHVRQKDYFSEDARKDFLIRPPSGRPYSIVACTCLCHHDASEDARTERLAPYSAYAMYPDGTETILVPLLFNQGAIRRGYIGHQGYEWEYLYERMVDAHVAYLEWDPLQDDAPIGWFRSLSPTGRVYAEGYASDP